MTTSPYKVDFNVGSEFGSSDCYVLPSLDSISLNELQNVQIETNIEEMKAFSSIFKYLHDEYISVGYPPNQDLSFKFLIDGDINNYSISIDSNDDLIFNFSNLLFYKEDLINIISNPSIIKDLIFEDNPVRILGYLYSKINFKLFNVCVKISGVGAIDIMQDKILFVYDAFNRTEEYGYSNEIEFYVCLKAGLEKIKKLFEEKHGFQVDTYFDAFKLMDMVSI